MKNIQFVGLFFLRLFCKHIPDTSDSVYAQERPVRLKVLCYNIRFGELASLEELATFIKEQNPDVVALQEVDCRTQRELTPKQHGKDFVTELGFRTGMLTAYGKTIPYAGGYYGIGILSKYPLASVERIYLPKTENGKEQRALLVANVEYSENRYFTFACTHLDYTNTEERQVQVKKLNEVLQAKPYPVIVAGDFNARPDSKEISEGMGTWKAVCKMAPTSPANAPRNQIDYIFCYPKDEWESVEATTYQVQLSDHLPISATVDLKK
jgi:endonuclease/exonuclease/phosphatase family metal-dependent hydrolase